MRQPLVVSTTALGIDQPVLACSICGCENVHLESVEVASQYDTVKVDESGASSSLGGASGRGSQVRMLLWCEAGCGFTVTFTFHKGLLMLKAMAAFAQRRDLWRD